MAASDPDQHLRPVPPERITSLNAQGLQERLGEEINRAQRHGLPLSCLLVLIDNLEELAREHGPELHEQTLAYVGGALRRELRQFDRVGRPSENELVVVLPGTDGPRGEIVARRVLERLRTIKIETEGTRRPLRVSVGLAAWREDLGAEELLAAARAAAAGASEENSAGDPGPAPLATDPDAGGSPPALGRRAPS